MADARITGLGVTLQSEECVFRATGKRIDFQGFLRAYVEGSDDPDAALEDQEVLLPHLERGDEPACERVEAVSHVTQPPARYTEATLVKELESDGVGRPSTYATVIGTILERGYAVKQGQALVPTFTAIAVTCLLERHFRDLVDTRFTAGMEQTLDDISEGNADWLPYLEKFFKGKQGLLQQVEEKTRTVDPAEARRIDLLGLDAKVRIGRFGPYIEREHDGEPLRVSLPPDIPPADLTGERIEELLRQKREGPNQIGTDPASGLPVYLLTGQYGPYVQLGEVTDEAPKPKRMSLPRGVKPEDVTLDLALGLLALPRLLGSHPATGGKVLAGLGRFGPYVVHDMGKDGKDYRSLKGDDHVLTVTLGRALELLAQPKLGRGRRAEPKPLKELGPHPEDQAPIYLYEGRYGPYFKHGDVSASVPRGREPDSVTLAEAVELLAERAAARPARRKAAGGRKGAAGAKTGAKAPKAAKKTAKKAARKAAPKKSGTRKA